MGTEPTGRSVEDRGTDPAGALVLAVVDLLEGVDDLLVATLGVLEDLLLAGRVVHALEGLLDVDGAHHDPGLPRPERAMRGYGRGVHAATIARLLAHPGRGQAACARVDAAPRPSAVCCPPRSGSSSSPPWPSGPAPSSRSPRSPACPSRTS